MKSDLNKGDIVEVVDKAQYGKCEILWIMQDKAMVSNGRQYCEIMDISQLKKITNPQFK